MELNFKLNENDYLEHQLYIASKSERIIQQRQKSLFTVIFAFLGLSYLFYTTDNKLMMYGFAMGSVLSVFFYPIYLKQHYFKHYKKFISDTYKNRFNEPIKVVFKENGIDCFDITGETKINLTIIEEIVETGKYIYLKIKTGGHLIIPKTKVEDITNVETYLISMALTLKISYHKELGWKWK